MAKRERKIRKKALNGRIIKAIKRDGREWQLHATKGWRSYRLAA